MSVEQNAYLEQIDNGVILPQQDKDDLLEIYNNALELFKVDVSLITDESEKDRLFNQYRDVLTSYGRKFSEIDFNLFLTKTEYLYIKSQIFDKVDLDRQNLLIALQLKSTLFDRYDGEPNSGRVSSNIYIDGSDVDVFPLSIEDVTRLSHISSLFVFKGVVSNNANIFYSIYKKISDISGLYELYKFKGDQLSQVGGNWVNGFGVENLVSLDENADVIVPKA